MRTLLLLRGTPASGKDYWVDQNNLRPYTLTADDIRLQLQSPVLNIDGKLSITQKNDGVVWTELFKLLEQRMQRGEFVVVNGTHYRSELLSRYKKLIDEYRYRAYIVDFTNVPLKTCLERNSLRDEYKRVPEEVIRKMYAVFDAEKDGVFKEISNRFKILPHENAVEILQENLLYDLNDKYSKAVIFGDIHGCYEPLKQYFEQNPVQEDTEYIFVGDYIDRGIQNKEVLDFISNHRKLPNFMFLEGNHENSLRKWCSKDYTEFTPEDSEKKIIRKYLGKSVLNDMYNQNIRSTVFKKETAPQIECIDKGELRQICRKFAQFTYFKLGDKKYLVTHGGLPCVPNIFVSTEEMIKGVGKYEDVETLYKSWHLNTDENTYQIHGHRNIFELPIVNDRCINLCDTPEMGKNLRIVEIDKQGNITPIYIKNEVYNKECTKVQERLSKIETKTDNELLQNLNQSKWVQKKVLQGGIISYNFTKDAFYKQHWDEITCKARGLFVDQQSEQVVCRSYEKFMNWGQGEDYSSHALKRTLKFPVYAYKKENGFLALITYNHKENSVMFCSKSTNQGDFVDYIKDTFYTTLSNTQQELIIDYCKNNNCTMIFECIRPKEDPHIIKYNKNELILLDIVTNSFEPKFVKYNELFEISHRFGLKCKQEEFAFTDFDSLHDFKKQISDQWNCKHEGYVLEDSNGFKVKLKSKYYGWWKQWRSVKEKLQKGQNIKKIYTNELDVKLYKLLLSYTPEQLQNMSIIDIADEFYKYIDM